MESAKTENLSQSMPVGILKNFGRKQMNAPVEITIQLTRY